MDRFSEEMIGSRDRYEGFDCPDENVDDGPSCREIWLRLQAQDAAACVRCGSGRETVVGDRQIRQGAVCCEGAA